MRVDRLELEGFRNYESSSVHLVPGLNLIVGRNAQGKTSLLEALYCLSGLGSPRGPDSQLIGHGRDTSLIRGDVFTNDRAVHIDIELRAGRGRRVLVNKAGLERGRALVEIVTAVFFGPDELALVKGAPDGRRRFLDELVVKLRPGRDRLRKEWDRVLKQRNALLRGAASDHRPDPSIEVWDEAFCDAGAALAAARLEVLGALVPFAAERYGSVAGAGDIGLTYVSSWVDKDIVTAALADPEGIDEIALRDSLGRAVEQMRAREIERGASLVGPQRDDVAVTIHRGDGTTIETRAFASQGDQRTSALGMKLGEHDLLTERLGHEPVLLLDDVFSELDPVRRAWLAKSVADLSQAVITTTAAEDLDLSNVQKVFEVAAGTVGER